MLALVQEIVQQLPAWLRWFQALAISIGSLGTAGAIIFAVYKFYRRGEHDPRLQPTATGTVTIRKGVAYVIATVTAANTGQVDVVLDLEPSGLSILTRKQGQGWQEIGLVYGVFPGQEKVQPGAELEDQIWIELPYRGEVAVVLELTIAGHAAGREEIQTWLTVEIVSLINGGNGGNFSEDG
jgi:hypothetical protein